MVPGLPLVALRTLAVQSSIAALCLALGAVGSTRGGEHWTSFRGPTDQGHADGAELPTRWSESENVVWKESISGKAWSSPVIVIAVNELDAGFMASPAVSQNALYLRTRTHLYRIEE